MKINSDRIRIANLRYFVEGKGIELADSLGKVILVDINGNGKYINPFAVEEDYPVFKRALVPNVRREDGLVYGTMMHHVCNDLVTGPCLVLTNESIYALTSKKELELSDVEDFVLKSPEFYKDRIKIISSRNANAFKYRKIIADDSIKLGQMWAFFRERESEKKKIKKN